MALAPAPVSSPASVADFVLLIEDDVRIGADVDRGLRASGYAVEWAHDGADGLGRFEAARASGSPCGLVVLDLGLPGLDGLDVCRRIRERDMQTPVLILSGRAEKRDIVRGLELGADDYVTKPFDTAELFARIASLLRRASARRRVAAPGDADDRADGGPIRRGALAVDPRSRRVVLRGEPVALTPKEFDLLLLLTRSPDRAFTRDEILDAVWGHGFDGYGHTVNTHINRLRAKIETDPTTPTCIETVWGVGYRFASDDGGCS